jgi:hypothetical protein
VLDATGTWCHFWHLPQDAAQKLQATGVLAESALDDRAVLSYPLQTLLNFATVPKQPASSRSGSGSSSGTSSSSTTSSSSSSSSTSSRRRPEISPALQGIPAANQFRAKIEFVRDVVREWTAAGGLGCSDMSRDRRLRWTGARETIRASGGGPGAGGHGGGAGAGGAGGVPVPPAKHVWVTIGARRGDARVACMVDPRRPAELGEDIDESRKR